jgi:hypothetical protein
MGRRGPLREDTVRSVIDHREVERLTVVLSGDGRSIRYRCSCGDEDLRWVSLTRRYPRVEVVARWQRHLAEKHPEIDATNTEVGG